MDRWTFENYTLLGDPTVPIWSGVPQVTALSGPSGMGLGPQSLNFTVTEGGSPVENALVCIAKDDESHAFGFTDAIGRVNLDFLPTTTGQSTVTVTGKNLVMSSRQIPVTAGSAFVALTSMAASDDGTGGSLGNGNQIVEAGEIIAFDSVLRETGGSGTSALTGTLSCSDPRVSIGTGTASYPAVGAGGTTSSQNPFVVYFVPGIGDGEEITFQIDVANGGSHYVSEWSVIVKAPELEVVSMDWEDATYGNGDGILDAGERIRITAILKNFGAGMADNVTGTLGTDEANVVLYDVAATWADIDLLEEASGSATFSLSLTNIVAPANCYSGCDRQLRADFPPQLRTITAGRTREHHHRHDPWARCHRHELGSVRQRRPLWLQCLPESEPGWSLMCGSTRMSSRAPRISGTKTWIS